jgi:hypothetical protein
MPFLARCAFALPLRFVLISTGHAQSERNLQRQLPCGGDTAPVKCERTLQFKVYFINHL